MKTSEEIKRILWEGANELRGSMDASKYKDYMLGLMFYKFLSDRTLDYFRRFAELGEVPQEKVVEEYTACFENDEYKDLFIENIKTTLGYVIQPNCLYQTWLQKIEDNTFEVDDVSTSLSEFERLIVGTKDVNDFKGLFSSSIIDVSNTALGEDLNKRSKNIKSLISLFSDLDMISLQNGDVLGDTYEYLIGMFASDAGKKAGEFYTPRQVSEVMAQIVAKSTEFHKSHPSIYDPTVGSASLLLTVRKHLDGDVQDDLHYYGQEFNTETYNLTRMNLLLHGIRPEKMTIKNGNTLAQDWPEDPERPNEGVQFDIVVMNPPYSDKKWNSREDIPLKVNDPRFADFGVLPPSSKGDFAYLMHGLYHLGQKGTMAIVLPHGVLFRGGAEAEIRKRLVDKNQIDAIIGLPSNLFTNTGIPVCIIILKKNRTLGEPIQIIDASKNFVKVGKNNVLQEKDIAKIVDAYMYKTEIAGYSHVTTIDEIKENEYNLNIPRYVEDVNKDIPEDVEAHVYGGIPYKNLEGLTLLNQLAKDTLESSYKEIRTGYIDFVKSTEEISRDIFANNNVQALFTHLHVSLQEYIEHWWKQLLHSNSDKNLVHVKETMLYDMKELLKRVGVVDPYEGYQIIAELWKTTLTHDLECILEKGFYEGAKLTKPNMVKKTKNKKTYMVQEGWIGEVIPNELLSETLFSAEREHLNSIKSQLDMNIDALNEAIDKALEEGTFEYDVLYECLEKETSGEAKRKFVKKNITNELKNYEKNSEEYVLLKETEAILEQKSSIDKTYKETEAELNNLVSNKFSQLTNVEIEHLVYCKWFDGIEEAFTKILKSSIQSEIDVIAMLRERYEDTLQDMDEEIARLEESLETLLQDLVVIE